VTVTEADLRDPQVAADYDLIYADWDGWADRVERLIEANLPVSPGAPLLDAACGTGIVCQAATQAGFLVTGADPSPAMIEIARRRLRPIDVDLRVASLDELSTAFVQRFDSVIAMGNDLPALPPEELPGALNEMRRVCREGGHLLVAIRDFSRRIPGGIWRDDGVARVSGRFVYDSPGVVGYVLDVEDDRGRRSHRRTLHSISPLQLATLIDAAGFRVLRQSVVAGRAVVAASAR
jgi:SAM-dependent methyltransferase